MNYLRYLSQIFKIYKKLIFLLKINGRVLFGLSHQDATEKIRKCCQHSSLSLLVLRNTKDDQSTTSSNQQLEQKELKSTTPEIINTNNDLQTPVEVNKITFNYSKIIHLF